CNLKSLNQRFSNCEACSLSNIQWGLGQHRAGGRVGKGAPPPPRLTSADILGNAYLSLFFNIGQNPSISQQALRAYEKVDPAGSCNPDLHFNRATLHKYEENYTEALEGFFHAASFESAWPKTWQPQQQLLDFLECLTSLLENTGKVKGNKLQSTLGSLHPSQMGPCGDGQYQGSLGQEVALERRLLSALQLCVNIGAIVLGRVSSALPQKRKCPCDTFSLADSEGLCFAVTVYNMFRLVLSAGGIHRPGPVGEEGYGKSPGIAG
uniref:Tetratricopeptide repeat domain 5 n=1 Tax=Chelonoidis abingdonii TaxID=106734 RepID=A0A8C0HA53_CHEAB